MSKSPKFYGVATDSPLGVGEIMEVESYRYCPDNGWSMMITAQWYPAFYIFYIRDNKIVYVKESQPHPGAISGS